MRINKGFKRDRVVFLLFGSRDHYFKIYTSHPAPPHTHTHKLNNLSKNLPDLSSKIKLNFNHHISYKYEAWGIGEHLT